MSSDKFDFDELLDVQLPERGEISCEECGKLFMQQRLDQIFCSKICRTTNRAEIARDRASKWAKEKHRINGQNWKKNNPTKREKSNKKSYLKQTYGITLEQYVQIQTNQNNKCAIYKKEAVLHIDHDHKTGRIRELLCPNCNRLLGMSKEDIEILQSAISYLNKWRACYS